MGYKVTDTREVATMTQTGTERKFYRVWLITDEGATGSVDISEKEWTSEAVPGILAEKADKLDLAFSLTG